MPVKVNSQFSNVNCPLKSYDLTPLNYLLSCYTKVRLSELSVPDLKNKLIRVIETICQILLFVYKCRHNLLINKYFFNPNKLFVLLNYKNHTI